MFAFININTKGYGKIYKSVMRNRCLPLLAKTIYAYFALLLVVAVLSEKKSLMICKSIRIPCSKSIWWMWDCSAAWHNLPQQRLEKETACSPSLRVRGQPFQQEPSEI